MMAVLRSAAHKAADRSREGDAMVEIKYDESKGHLKLPKNIRQVGKPDNQIKIYVEDYVVTYINQLAFESPLEERLAILLGNTVQNKDASIIFIHGAIEVENVNIQDEHIGFTSCIWSKIYEDIKTYFGDAKVVGWFLTRPGKALKITEKITKIHVDNFPGEGRTLFVIDPLDNEEAFYVYCKGELIRQEGYYIYYERNEDMQNYMIESKKKSAKVIEEEIPVQEKMPEPVVAIQQKKKEKNTAEKYNVIVKRATRYASMLLLLAVVVAGITFVTGKKSENEPSSPVNAVPEESVTPVDEVGGNVQGQTDTVQPQTDQSSAPETNAPDTSVPTSVILGTDYTIADGDTLAGISKRFYNNLSYVDKICELNGISDPDKIFPGMIIKLP